tara:strand:- start:915 stop:1319 length:405 start_codon:yes stop_codon:yes gene_type:complete
MLGIAESVVGVAGKVLDKFVSDKDLKTKLEHELRREMISLDALQAQANVESAKHPSLFVSGARPFLLWGTGLGLLWGTLFGPIASWACAIWAPDVVLPAIETEQLTSLVLALLGLGGMRSFDKAKGTGRNNMRS